MVKLKTCNSAWILLTLGFALILLDAITKYLTYSLLPLSNRFSLWYPYGGVPVFKDFLGVEFSINHTINHGAAWGIFSEAQSFLLVLRIIMIVGLVVYLLFYNTNKMTEVPLLFITAGALGNVLDTFIYGHVVDMFHFVLWGYDFPVFNVADICITLGVASVFINSLIQPEKAYRT